MTDTEIPKAEQSNRAAHTPGPWYVIPNYTSAPAGVQTSNGEVIADVYARPGFNPITVWVEVKANAALIAAAPDLLAACKAVNGETPAAGEPGHIDLRQAFIMVRAAIARAEGRQP